MFGQPTLPVLIVLYRSFWGKQKGFSKAYEGQYGFHISSQLYIRLDNYPIDPTRLCALNYQLIMILLECWGLFTVRAFWSLTASDSQQSSCPTQYLVYGSLVFDVI